MFIRRTQTRNTASGETYSTYRLVCSARVGGKVKQLTLSNLRRHFDLDPAQWPALCLRLKLKDVRAGQAGCCRRKGLREQRFTGPQRSSESGGVKGSNINKSFENHHWGVPT